MHLAKEVATLLDKKAIEKVQPENGEFVNSYFTNYKKNHTPEKPKIRAILNLKPINKSVRKVKFRMKTLNVVRQFLQKDHFMVFIDVGLSIGLENTSSTNLFYFICEMGYFHIRVFPSH